MGIPKDAKIRLVIFDLDGTLADTKQDLALSVNAMRASLNLPALADEVISSYVGRGVAVLVRKALGDSFSPEQVEGAQEFFLNYYRQHMLDHTALFPGVKQALDRLRGRELAVLTNKPEGFSREMLAGLEIASYFSRVYGGDSFARRKPDPIGVLRLMEDAHVGAPDALMVGDSDTDVQTGRNAGIWTCGVTYGFGADSLKTSPPDLLLDDLSRLPAALDATAFEDHR